MPSTRRFRKSMGVARMFHDPSRNTFDDLGDDARVPAVPRRLPSGEWGALSEPGSYPDFLEVGDQVMVHVAPRSGRGWTTSMYVHHIDQRGALLGEHLPDEPLGHRP